MYILFLGLLYKLQRGRFRSFVRALMGYDVDADMTPTTPTAAGKVATKKASYLGTHGNTFYEPAYMYMSDMYAKYTWFGVCTYAGFK